MQNFLQIPFTFSYFFIIKEWKHPDESVTKYLSITFLNLDDNFKFALEDYCTTESGGLDTMIKMIIDVVESKDQNQKILYGNIYNLNITDEYIYAINPHDEYIKQPCSFKIKTKIMIMIMKDFFEQQTIFSKIQTANVAIRNIKYI